MEYDIETDENGEEYIDWYTITFGDDEENAEQYEQFWELSCQERCWDDEDCFEKCMQEYRR